MTQDPSKAAGKVGPWARYRRLSLGVKILIWMAGGVVLGLSLPEVGVRLRPLGDLFIRLLLMAAIPLVFFNLIAGITSLPGIGILGRLGIRTLIYYLSTTTVALSVGLTMTHWLQPGRGVELSEPVDDAFGSVPSLTNVVVELFPENVFASLSAGSVAQVVVFAVFLGIATLTLPPEPKARLQEIFALFATLLRELVRLVLAFAPLGVGALAASTVGAYGGAIFGPLGRFVVAVWSAQLVMAGLYMLLLLLLSRHPPHHWLRRTAPLYATTAATCSSLASLVVSMDIAERRLKIPKSIYSFTLPLGAQLNKDGTAIMLTGVLAFTAQAAGIELEPSRLIAILVIGLILSEGSSGIPGGGLVIALIFVEAFHLPVEIAVIVGGIYRLIDMGSTTINCMGDLAWTTILADLEGRRSSRG